MKKILLLVFLVLLFLVFSLLYANMNFSPKPLDEELALTPRYMDIPKDEAVTEVEPEPISSIDNLFSPDRGLPREEAPGEVAPTDRPNFELVGIIMLNDQAGAIIENKNQGGMVPAKQRRHYMVGAEMGNGFVLESVSESIAILRRNGEIIELRIGRERTGAKAKGAAVLERQEIPVVPMEVKTEDEVLP